MYIWNTTTGHEESSSYAYADSGNGAGCSMRNNGSS
ncbi:unnamed protein product [Larinioides sclopetarius]|uniref:Uncharacterized protein n=1 Tax=Larinioides sclopetarius TaxID=280406 RepID=A0AAV2A5B6_9ARAC